MMKQYFLSAILLGTGINIGLAQVSASVVAAGFTAPTPIAVAPGQIMTFFLHGIGSSLTTPIRANTTPLPTSLDGISAMFVQNNPARPIPILAVEPVATCSDKRQPGCTSYTAVTVQIPFEIEAQSPTARRGVPVAGAQVQFIERGMIAAAVDVLPFVDEVHLLQTCDLVLTKRDFACRPVVTHADGTMVTADNAARVGEQVVIYGVGLGLPRTPVATGQVVSDIVSTATTFGISFDARSNARASRPSVTVQNGFAIPTLSPMFSGFVPGFVGLYQINVIIPMVSAGIAPCSSTTSPAPGERIDSNLTISVGGLTSFDGAGICVQPTSFMSPLKPFLLP